MNLDSEDITLERLLEVFGWKICKQIAGGFWAPVEHMKFDEMYVYTIGTDKER